MNFKEFLEEEEYFDLGIDEVLGSSLKFLGGVGGNLVSQTGRGLGNIARGLSQGVVGTGQGTLGALQMVSGGSEKGKETFSKGLSNLGGGLGRVVRGAVQTGGALSGVSPILRGAQATSEPLGISGIYAPDSGGRKYFQDLLGLDSWKKPEPKPEISKSNLEKKPDEDAVSFLRDLEKKDKIDQKEKWKRIVSDYKSAKTSVERENIRNLMRRKFPSLYMQAVEAGKRKKSRI